MNNDNNGLGTGSAKYFQRGVVKINEQLSGDESAAAQEMLDEARTLAEIFDRWAEQRPSDDERETVLRGLFRLDKRAEGHVRSRPKGA